ncbi:retention module-containing protein [Pseudomonas fluorescens]|uniref:retention module-containing protein n=1 Tax=Pseudomonas fluorescens TaxID=294 RepID=UPI00123F2306|nr:retention module-containing protein [Pseudomonas fluorescens]VVN42897.1 hypothetical protein PS639_05483 [Pseudomonas fluorescens]
MAKLIGIVSNVIGQVFAVSSDGFRRVLIEGDRLFAGEQLLTGAEGAVAVHLQNGQELTLGRGSSLQMTSQLLAHQAPHVDITEAVTPSQAQLTDVEQLQKVIAAGADPTQTGEATAAGPGHSDAGKALGGGHSFVMLEEVAGRVDPTLGFATEGFNRIVELPREHVVDGPDKVDDGAVGAGGAGGTGVVSAPPVVPDVVDNPVTLIGLSVTGGELTLNEANLADGSACNPGALTQHNTFTVIAPDGLSSLSIGGINVISGGVAAGFPLSIVTPLGNTLSITGYDPATGVVSYSYTLLDNETHPNANGANSISEDFNVVATDVDGSTASGQINVNIVDDLPSAVNDSHVRTASEARLNLHGNVLSNDVQGADQVPTGHGSGPITPGTFNGTYGTLVLNADGTYTYILNTSDADFKALHGGGNGTETFTYTLTDADGDTSTANLVLNIHNNDDPVIIKGLDVDCGELTVYEKNLCDGSCPDAPALTQSGSFCVTAPDGLHTLTVGGIAVVTGGVAAGFPQSIVTALGNTLTITGYNPATGVVHYSYTLVDNETHPKGHGANSLTEHFNVVATDSDGSTASGQIDVNIVDDVPNAVAAERSVAAAQIDSNLLLVIDVSGSMADASGVNGLSRLALAKQAICALLDQYDDLGDVKVQIVTFSSHASDKTSVWVDVATAKSIIAGLRAGGDTNYDAAVAVAKTAFDTDGKLTGAQNVGYFFSDGKPNEGSIGRSDEAAWKAFLEDNDIKNYAIGLGKGVSNDSLDPLAYDGSTGTNTNAVIVKDLGQLNSVLSGTVVGVPVTGSLLGEGGTFGADGGFIKSITVDGTTYTYNPKGNDHQGSLSFSGGANHGSFNTANNTLSIATDNKGTLLVNLDTGEYSYTSQKTTAVVLTENIGFTVSDNDGDRASSTLVVKVIPNGAPVAVDDHVITNVLSGSVVLPGELLLANDTDPEGDPLTAAPTTFNTGWIAKGADFCGTGAINFTGGQNCAPNQTLANVRSAFAANAATMTAVLVVSGYLGKVTHANANDEDRITVNLKQGETLNLDHNLAAGHIAMEYSVNGGAFIAIADGQTITATSDATYRIHITNTPDGPGHSGKGSENYTLTMTVNYSGAHDVTPDYHGPYTASDNHGGSDSAVVTISYQDGHTLVGTADDDVLVAGTGDNLIHAGGGNDVLTAGSGNNTLHGEAGNDLLFSGSGNDLLDGGTGNDTASYAHATARVTVDLGLAGAQATGGAGTDTLTAIENLTGSNFNDALTGDSHSNIITGGLGKDILNGGDGDDFLIGGLGNNTLTGGAGADTFQWLKGNSGHDVVTDFTPGTDKLDLSQLLQGENGTAASLDDYLHFKISGSGDSLVTRIDVSGMAGGATNQTIDLAGVNLASHYGVTPGAGGVIAGGHDTATIINGMLNDHSLKVDTV